MNSCDQTSPDDGISAIDAIYMAARTPEFWGDTLAIIRKYMNAHSVCVIGFDASKHVTLALADSIARGFDREATSQASLAYPVFESAKRTRNSFVIDCSGAKSAEPAFADYCRWLDEQGLTVSLGALLPDEVCGNLLATLHWTPERAPPQQDIVAMFEEIRPHLERGFQIARRIEERTSYRDALWGLIGYSPHGVLAIDATMKIRHANDEARRILDECDGLEMRGQKLVAREQTVNSRLSDLIQNGSNSRSHSSRTSQKSIVVRRPSNRLPVILMAVPAGTCRPELACGPPITFLFLRDLARELDTSITAFAMAFSLTPAEKRLVRNLASGLTLSEHSDAEGTSDETARWHLKNIFVKTHCRSQMQLLNLVRKSSMPRL